MRRSLGVFYEFSGFCKADGNLERGPKPLAFFCLKFSLEAV